MFGNWGFGRLDQNYKQSIRVMKEAEHADRPRPSGGAAQPAEPGKLLIGENAAECLANDLRDEQEIQRPLLVQAVALARPRPTT